jgi:hypothetical protein
MVSAPELIFQDFHNFVHILLRWLEEQANLPNWQPAVFQTFWGANGFVLALCLAWWVGVRSNTRGLRDAAWKRRIVHWLIWSSALLPVLSILMLLSLPRDPKNVVFAGLSAVRFAVIALLFAAACFWAFLGRRKVPGDFFVRLERRFSTAQGLKGIAAVSVVALLCVLLLQIRISFNATDQILVGVQRFLPLLIWAITQAAILLLAIALWRGYLRRSVFYYARQVLEFLAANPVFVYLGLAIVLLLVSQALDRDYLLLPVITSDEGGFMARNWHILTEETLEFIAAIQLCLAGAVVPRKR